MIISHKHKFIFVKTKKVGGTSLELALASICGEDDIITPTSDEEIRKQLNFIGPQNYLNTYKDLGKRGSIKLILGLRKRHEKYLRHYSCIRIRDKIGTKIWNEYYKFTVMRNPYDFIVSHYFSSKREESFKDYLLSNPDHLLTNWNIISNEKNEIMVDQVIKYEEYEKGLNTFSNKINLDDNIYKIFKTIKAKTDRRPDYATVNEMFKNFNEGKKLVEIINNDEIKFGNYEKL